MAYKKYPVRLMAKNMSRLTELSLPVNIPEVGEEFRPSILVKVGETVNKSTTQLTVLEVRHNLGNEALLEHLDEIFSAQKRMAAVSGDQGQQIMVLKDLFVDFKTVDEMRNDVGCAYNYDKYRGLRVIISPIVIQPIGYTATQFEDFLGLVRTHGVDPYIPDLMKKILPDGGNGNEVFYNRVKALLDFTELLATQVFHDVSGAEHIKTSEVLVKFLIDTIGAAKEIGAKDKFIYQFYVLSDVRARIPYSKSSMAYIKMTFAGVYEQDGVEKLELITEDCWKGLVAHYNALYNQLESLYPKGGINPDTLDLQKLQMAEYPTHEEFLEKNVVYNNEVTYSALNWFYTLREDFSLSLVSQRVRYDIGRRLDARINNLPEGKSFTCIQDPTSRYCDELFMNYVRRCQTIYRNMLLPRELRNDIKGPITHRVADVNRPIGSLYRDANDYLYSKWMCRTYRTASQQEFYEANKNRTLFFNKELVTDYLMGNIPLFTMKVGANANLATDMFNGYKTMIKNWILPLSLDLLKRHPMKESIQKAVTLESPIYIPQRDLNKDDPGVMVRMTKGKQAEGDSMEANMPGNAATVHLCVNFVVVLNALEVPVTDVNSYRFIEHLVRLAES